MRRKKFSHCKLFCLCGLVAGVLGAQAAELALLDEICVRADGVVAPFGTPGDSGTLGPANGNPFRYTVRERDNTGQANRRIATFLKFDISGLAAADVNDSGFMATFTIEHVGHLNAVNHGMNLMFGRVDDGSWDDGGSANPDFSWGLGSADQTTLLVNMANYPNATNLVVDVTDIVKDWVLGNTSHQGIVLFGEDRGGNASNASYLQNASITVIASFGDEVDFTGAVDGDWSKAGNWDSGSYPLSSEVAVLNSTANLSNGVPNNVLAIRIGTTGTGTLNLLPGSALLATASSDWGSLVGTNGAVGTINQSGGSNVINFIEVGQGGSGAVNISGGLLTLSGNNNGYSAYVGSVAGGIGSIEISGGAFNTEAGVHLGLPDGSGTGTFRVQGAAATEIGIGSAGDSDGSWQQFSNSVFQVGISTTGVTPVLIADSSSAGVPAVTLASGSMLDVGFIDGAMETNAWPVMISEGMMFDNGMVFDPAMGATTNDWGFVVSNNTLYVGYGLGWPAGGDFSDGLSNLVAATFNGIDDGLNESFQSLDNGVGNPSWDNATGEASMSAEDPSSGTVGCVSETSVDGSAFSQLTASFVIEGITDPDNGPSHNGHWIGLIGNDSRLWNNAELGGGVSGWAVGIRFLGGNVDFVYDNTSGNEVVMGSLGSYTAASLQDGYAAEIIVNTNGWWVMLEGIDSSTGGSGLWPAGFDYSAIDADTSVFVAMTYQQDSEAGTVVDMGSISIVGIEGPSKDRDGDGMSNEYETANGLNPDDASDRDTDLDGDGLTNYEEYVLGTSPGLKDSDKDGLDDGEELNSFATNPLDADSDDDFLNDYDEIVQFRTNPNLKDSDSDGADDGVELAALSNPLALNITPTGQDSDDDGLLDSIELAAFGNLDSTGLDDNDGDNYPNIVEQALGSELDNGTSVPKLHFDNNGELTFRRHLLAGVGYELQVSEDLATWTSFLGYLTEHAPAADTNDYERASYRAPLDVDKLFMRVQSRTEIAGRPNIVLIYTDDQGYGDMAANNPNSKFPTPALDQLAAQGINFTDGHCADTVCTPSRYGLLTGRYCWRTHFKTSVLGADSPALIPDTRMTLASLLRENGYATAMIGKWHLGMDIPGTNGNRDFSRPINDMPLDVGFDYFYGIPASLNFGYLAWIEGRYTAVNPTLFTAKKPNTLPGVFSDYRITPPYDRSSGLEVAPDFDDVLCLTRFTDKAIEWMGQQVEDARAGNPFFIYIPFTSSHKPVIPRDDFLGRSDAGAYGDFVMETDYHIGNILKFLDESGLANNTMIIFTSDNGPESTYNARVSTYDHDSAGIYRGGKRDIYEGGHRVPFVIRWPAGISSPGRVYDKPVCQTDLLATLAEMLGITLDDNSGEDSVSFYDVLRDDTAAPARLPMVHHEINGRFAVREGDWKLVMPWEGAGYELYNLSSDPTESSNVYAANPAIAADLEAELTEIVTSGRTTPGAAVGNDTGWWDDLEWIDPADY